MKYQLVYRENLTLPYHVIDSGDDIDALKAQKKELIKSRKYIGYEFSIIDCDTWKAVSSTRDLVRSLERKKVMQYERLADIKFRGKGIQNKLWYYGYYLYNEKLDSHFIYTIFGDMIQVNPETVTRFTGSTDKDNVGIYEGDILEIDSSDCIMVADGYEKSYFLLTYDKIEDDWEGGKFSVEPLYGYSCITHIAHGTEWKDKRFRVISNVFDYTQDNMSVPKLYLESKLKLE